MDDASEDPRQTPHHPRARYVLYGQEDAERSLLQAYTSGRMHHAWLLCGPQGIGKATLAYRFARFVLANPQPELVSSDELYVAPDHPVARRIEARGHADLLTLERPFDPKTKRIKSIIDVAQARRAPGFYAHTAAEGGWRVCIVDAADDLNGEAANALLKCLEEPPMRSLFLLVAHSPGRLLATIRSRCIALQLRPLDARTVSKVVHEVAPQTVLDDGFVAEFSAGSAGRALQLASSGAGKKFKQFIDILDAGAPFDRKPVWALCDYLAQRKNDEDYHLFCDLLQQRVMSEAEGQAANNIAQAARLAEHACDISHSIRRANALNLDRREVLLDAIESLERIKLDQRAA